jgi:hypothetical protein
MENSTVTATTEYLQSQIADKDVRIQQLEEHIQRVTTRDYSTAAKINSLVESMKQWTIDELESNQITSEQAEAIAEICGFELSKEVEVQVNVTYYITVEVPAGEDVEDIINDIDFDAITYDVDKVTHVSSSVDSIDF